MQDLRHQEFYIEIFHLLKDQNSDQLAKKSIKKYLGTFGGEKKITRALNEEFKNKDMITENDFVHLMDDILNQYLN